MFRFQEKTALDQLHPVFGTSHSPLAFRPSPFSPTNISRPSPNPPAPPAQPAGTASFPRPPRGQNRPSDRVERTGSVLGVPAQAGAQHSAQQRSEERGQRDPSQGCQERPAASAPGLGSAGEGRWGRFRSYVKREGFGLRGFGDREVVSNQSSASGLT